MSKNKINIILTGGTGTLGSQVIYELLNQENIQTIFLPVREKNGKSATSRIQKILESDAAPDFVVQNMEDILKKVKVLDMEAFFKPETFLSKEDTNYFIHSAGCVNLSTDESQREIIFSGNVDFTKKIFTAFSGYIVKFSYISTAFSIGNIGGLIENDYHNATAPQYRNFYEESKHEAEKYLLQEGKEKNVDIQILRPSVLGRRGKSSEAPAPQELRRRAPPR